MTRLMTDVIVLLYKSCALLIVAPSHIIDSKKYFEIHNRNNDSVIIP